MIVGGLKRSIEPLIKVPSEYFKIMKISNDGKYPDSECARLTETLKSFKWVFFYYFIFLIVYVW